MNSLLAHPKLRGTSLYIDKHTDRADRVLETKSPPRDGCLRSKKPRIITELQPLCLNSDLPSSSRNLQDVPAAGSRNYFYKNLNSPNSSRSRLFSKRTDITLKTIRSNPQIDYLSLHEREFLQNVSKAQFSAAYASLQSMIVIAVEQDSLPSLLSLHRIAALFFITCRDWVKAVVYLANCKFLAQFTRNLDIILWSNLQIGHICKYTKQYEEGKAFFKKALEYTWFLKDVDQELACYDELGKLFYLNSEMEEAKLLHQKFIDGDYEPESSSKRQMSNRQLQSLFRLYPTLTDSINSYLLSQIIDFPFRLVQNVDPEYFVSKGVKNEHLINNNQKCVPNERLLKFHQPLEDLISEQLKTQEFELQIGLPSFRQTKLKFIKNTSSVPMLKQNLKNRIKKLQFPTLQPNCLPDAARVPQEQRKKTLDQLVSERLKAVNSPQHLKLAQPPIYDAIRVSSDYHYATQHTRAGMICFAQKLFSNHTRTNISIPSIMIDNIIFEA